MSIEPIRRALLSVTDKTGIVEFARGLVRLGVEIISTGGTATQLAAAGVPVTSIEHVTGFPEIMHGRVKTLHPKVHGGILALRDNPEHAAAMKKHEIAPIDLVCVNLYAFESTVAKPDCTREDAIENIDIGGPSMIRSAAKNHHHVTIVTRPSDYHKVLAEMQANKGGTTDALRAVLAAEAFATTARYDAAIAAYLAERHDSPYPALLTLSYVRADELRYGENPHQSAALYKQPGYRGPSLAGAEQLHGKELSYNNINDGAAALGLVEALAGLFPDDVGACVVKHTNPCGAAIAPREEGAAAAAIDEALAGDPVAAFGGIIAINAPVDAAAAERLCAKDAFFEVIIAPRFTPDALETLRTRWTNVRLLAVGDLSAPPTNDSEIRSIPGGLLMQSRDHKHANATERIHRAGPAPTREQSRSAAFLEAVGRCLFSNAVVLGGASPKRVGVLRMFGAGAGQMDRVTSCRLAVEKAGPLARGSVCFSDAFFPFADGPAILAEAGVAAIAHPGGSKRDQDTFDLCNARNISCITTGLRHFRH